jgi:hypothetical protein
MQKTVSAVEDGGNRGGRKAWVEDVTLMRSFGTFLMALFAGLSEGLDSGRLSERETQGTASWMRCLKTSCLG